MIFYYVRHGHPTYNPDQLTPLGKRQAEAVGKRLAAHGIDRIFSSTSNRAIETATPLSEITGKQIELLDFANEKYAAQNFMAPNKEGVKVWVSNIDEIKTAFALPEIKNNPEWYNLPQFDGYTFKEGVERVNRECDALFEKLGYKHNREKGYFEPVAPTEERVALFAHAGFGSIFLSSVLDTPYPQMANLFGMGHTSITVIQFKETFGYCVPHILTYANDGHIYKEGLPTNYCNIDNLYI